MSPDRKSANCPSPREVEAIAAIPNRIVRNLRITECYYRLSVAMAALTGAGANWCTFATWASRQAGSTIRAEDFLDHLGGRLRTGWTLLHPVQSLWRAFLRRGVFDPETLIGRVVRAVHSPFDAFERASDAVAAGNLKVFAEIGLVFARHLESGRTDAGFAEFLSTLRPGPPPDGQDGLRRAFACYRRQAAETAPEARAQWILLANLEIGLHEQARLQPEIQAALEVAPVTAEDLGARALRVLAPGSRWLRPLRRPLGAVLGRYRRFARELTRRAVTDALMVLRLPGAVLHLGRHLDRPAPGALSQLTLPPLRELCARLEPPGACSDCGARDWADLSQRMHYILHLFRAWHFEAALIEAPFTPAQVERLMAGRVPDGML